MTNMNKACVYLVYIPDISVLLIPALSIHTKCIGVLGLEKDERILIT